MTILFFALPTVASADTLEEDELQQCGSIADATARLACYDRLNDRQQPEQRVEEQEQQVESRQQPLEVNENAAALERIGEESLDRTEEKREKLEVQARIVGCRRQASGDYYFYLENGQIWKQKSERRLMYKQDCNLDVTITRDFFGYKMLVAGEDRKIRISRLK